MIPLAVAALVFAALATRGSPSSPVVAPPPPVAMRSASELVIAKFEAVPGGLLGSKPMTVVDVRQKGTTAGKKPLAEYNPISEGVQDAGDALMGLGRDAFKAAKLEWLFDWVDEHARWIFAPVFIPDWFEVLAGGRIRPDNVLLANFPPETLDRLRAEGRLA